MENGHQTIFFYNDNAHSYFEETKNLLLKNEINRLAELCGFKGNILDIGPGSGRDLKEFKKLGFKAKGADISEKMAIIAHNFSGCEVITSDTRQLPFQNEFFIGVWAKASLHHIPKKELGNALREIYRITKKGGFFYSSVKSGHGEKLVPINGYNRFYSFYKESEFKTFIEKSGFCVMDCYISTGINPKRPDKFINVFAKKE